MIKTKLFLPPLRPERVARPRIIAALNQGLQVPLVLLSSLPGSGKTTALAEWVRQLSIPAAWLSLDEGDNDPARFWGCVVAALQTIFPALGRATQAVLAAPEPFSAEAIVDALVSELSAAGEFVLVLDDFHAIQSPPLQSAMALLIDRLPPGAHLVIATRADPRFPLARLRVKNRLLELRIDELRFTAGETGDYLNRVMGLDLSGDDLAALEARTEGWIASLQMAALSLKRAPDAPAFVRAFSGSNRYVMDYLVEEVLQAQPPQVQDFLLQTSLLERLSGALCDAVCAGQGGQAMLEYLDRSNLFLVPLDEERTWYRYHHLFASLLRARLAHSTAFSTQALRRRAADWLDEHGFPEEAIQHALAGQDFPRAANLIERVAQGAWFQGQYTRLSEWIAALPRELVLSRPWLCVWNAWSFSQTGPLPDAAAWLAAAQQAAPNKDQALPGMGASSPEFPSLRYEIAALQVLVACLQQDYDRAEILAAPVLQVTPPPGLTSAQAAQCHALHALCYKYYVDGDLAKAEAANLETMRIAREIDFTLRYIHGANKLAFVYQTAGQLQRCYRHIQGALADLREQGLGAYFAARLLYCRLAGLLYEWDRLDEAQRLAADHLIPDKPADPPYLLVDGENVRARFALHAGDFAAAQQALDRAAALSRQSYIWPGLAWQHEALQVRLWLRSGDLAAARAWASTQPGEPPGLLPFVIESRLISRARVYLAGGEGCAAAQLLAQLAEAAQAGGRMGSLVEILTLQALALQQEGQSEAAIAALERAILLAEPEGYVRTLLDEGEPLAALLFRLAHEGRSAAPGIPLMESACAYARRLLARAQGEAAAAGVQPRPSNPDLVEPLSRRELEVLRCMAGGLSNPETAVRLVIETATVKRHINSIFAKLGVNSRVQALNRARELHLL